VKPRPDAPFCQTAGIYFRASFSELSGRRGPRLAASNFLNPPPPPSTAVVPNQTAIVRQSARRKRRVRVARKCSGSLLPPSPPAEKTTASHDQARDSANAITVPKGKAC
jgi:hypothetical protein